MSLPNKRETVNDTILYQEKDIKIALIDDNCRSRNRRAELPCKFDRENLWLYTTEIALYTYEQWSSMQEFNPRYLFSPRRIVWSCSPNLWLTTALLRWGNGYCKYEKGVYCIRKDRKNVEAIRKWFEQLNMSPYNSHFNNSKQQCRMPRQWVSTSTNIEIGTKTGDRNVWNRDLSKPV